jgi:hypothetical protein
VINAPARDLQVQAIPTPPHQQIRLQPGAPPNPAQLAAERPDGNRSQATIIAQRFIDESAQRQRHILRLQDQINDLEQTMADDPDTAHITADVLRNARARLAADQVELETFRRTQFAEYDRATAQENGNVFGVPGLPWTQRALLNHIIRKIKGRDGYDNI